MGQRDKTARMRAGGVGATTLGLTLFLFAATFLGCDNGGIVLAVCTLGDDSTCPAGKVCRGAANLPAGKGICVPGGSIDPVLPEGQCTLPEGAECKANEVCVDSEDTPDGIGLCLPIVCTSPGTQGECLVGQICQATSDGRGECVPACIPGDDGTCPGEDKCLPYGSGGACFDKDSCVYGDDNYGCGTGKECIDDPKKPGNIGTCVPVPCTTNPDSCPPNYTCQGTSCVPTDGCTEDSHCPGDWTCDTDSGLCMPAPTCSTDPHNCPPGYLCDAASGTCVPLVECDPATPVVPGQCPPDGVCLPWGSSGACFPAGSCLYGSTVHDYGCGNGEECIDDPKKPDTIGTCTPVPCTTNPDSCPDNFVCQGGNCVPEDGCRLNSHCPDGMNCVNGLCLPDDCDGDDEKCPDGWLCDSDGKCIEKCNPTLPGQCTNGKCLPIGLADPTDGRCVSDDSCVYGSNNPDYGCTDPDELCVDDPKKPGIIGTCVPEVCNGVQCPPGYTCQGDGCVPEDGCTEDSHCPGEWTCDTDSGLCMPAPNCSANPHNCPQGYLCDAVSGTCVPIVECDPSLPVVPGQCPGDDKCLPWGTSGACFPEDSCVYGNPDYGCEDNKECEEDATRPGNIGKCAVECEEDDECDSGLCLPSGVCATCNPDDNQGCSTNQKCWATPDNMGVCLSTDECDNDAQCAPGKCYEGQCVPACTANNQCDSGACLNPPGVCVTCIPGANNQGCSTNQKCWATPDGMGICLPITPPCTDGQPCGNGGICLVDTCVPACTPGDHTTCPGTDKCLPWGTGGACFDKDSCVYGSNNPAYGCEGNYECEADPARPGNIGKCAVECEEDDECDSGLCLPSGVCATCDPDEQKGCDADQKCWATPDNMGVCLSTDECDNDAQCAPGKCYEGQCVPACTANDQCDSGVCRNPPGVCVTCIPGDDNEGCGTNQKCWATPDGMGICLPTTPCTDDGRLCGNGGVCVGNQCVPNCAPGDHDACPGTDKCLPYGNGGACFDKDSCVYDDVDYGCEDDPGEPKECIDDPRKPGDIGTCTPIPCTTDPVDNCPDGFVCQGTGCVPEDGCEEDSHCPHNMTCEDGLCMPGLGDCSVDPDNCPTDYVCDEFTGNCVKFVECDPTLPVRPGQCLPDGVCLPWGDYGACFPKGSCLYGSDVHDYSCTGNSEICIDDPLKPTDLLKPIRIGTCAPEPCNINPDNCPDNFVCQGTSCVPESGCTEDSHCPGAWVCDLYEGANGVCIPKPKCSDTPNNCPAGWTCDESGVCLPTPCNPDADRCPQDKWMCFPTGPGVGECQLKVIIDNAVGPATLPLAWTGDYLVVGTNASLHFYKFGNTPLPSTLLAGTSLRGVASSGGGQVAVSYERNSQSRIALVAAGSTVREPCHLTDTVSVKYGPTLISHSAGDWSFAVPGEENLWAYHTSGICEKQGGFNPAPHSPAVWRPDNSLNQHNILFISDSSGGTDANIYPYSWNGSTLAVFTPYRLANQIGVSDVKGVAADGKNMWVAADSRLIRQQLSGTSGTEGVVSNSGFVSPPALDEAGNAYVVWEIGSNNYELRIYDSSITGNPSPLKKSEAFEALSIVGSPILGEPLAGVAPAEVYVVTTNGIVYAFRADTLQLLQKWTIQLDISVNPNAQPVLKDNRLWIVDRADKKLRGVLVKSDGLNRDAQWPKMHRDNCNSNSHLTTEHAIAMCF